MLVGIVFTPEDAEMHKKEQQGKEYRISVSGMKLPFQETSDQKNIYCYEKRHSHTVGQYLSVKIIHMKQRSIKIYTDIRYQRHKGFRKYPGRIPVAPYRICIPSEGKI